MLPAFFIVKKSYLSKVFFGELRFFKFSVAIFRVVAVFLSFRVFLQIPLFIMRTAGYYVTSPLPLLAECGLLECYKICGGSRILVKLTG